MFAMRRRVTVTRMPYLLCICLSCYQKSTVSVTGLWAGECHNKKVPAAEKRECASWYLCNEMQLQAGEIVSRVHTEHLHIHTHTHPPVLSGFSVFRLKPMGKPEHKGNVYDLQLYADGGSRLNSIRQHPWLPCKSRWTVPSGHHEETLRLSRQEEFPKGTETENVHGRHRELYPTVAFANRKSKVGHLRGEEYPDNVEPLSPVSGSHRAHKVLDGAPAEATKKGVQSRELL